MNKEELNLEDFLELGILSECFKQLLLEQRELELELQHII
jgi:hypothetical protein